MKKKPDGIQFLDVHGKATLMDLYPADEDDDDSQASDVDYEEESDEDDESLIVDKDVQEEDTLSEDSEDHDDDPDDDNGNDMNDFPDHRDEDLLEDDNKVIAPEQQANIPTTDAQNPDIPTTQTNQNTNNQQNNTNRNTRQPRMLYEIESTLDGNHWKDQVVGAMVNNDDDEINKVKAMQEYFTMEASKSTPQYGFRKGLEIFGEDGKQAAMNELKNNLVGHGCLNMLHPHEVTPLIQKKALSYLMFLKRKRCGKIKGCRW
mgnify:FL=1